MRSAARGRMPCPSAFPPPRAVTSISTQSDVAHQMARGASRLDFASHVKVQLRTLRSRLERRNALIEVVRDANATRDPQKVAAWLVRQADDWIHAPCWAVVAPRPRRAARRVLADKGLVPALQPSVSAVAGWVTSQGVEFMSADLAKDRRARGECVGTVMAFPLLSRSRTVGVLVGLDPDSRRRRSLRSVRPSRRRCACCSSRSESLSMPRLACRGPTRCRSPTT